MRTDEFATRELAIRRVAGLTRRLRQIDGAQGTWVTVEGRRTLLLCSNNYLGLANHPALIEAAQRAALQYGVGTGASRLISGSMRPHHVFEQRLAAFKSTEAALLFTSGYHANIGAITALVGREDAVFSDRLNHASIIDGCRLSGARVVVYPHADTAALEASLRSTPARRRLIVTDSIFSMEGDTAPLTNICAIAKRYDAMVMVDEAHATGIVGPHGGGVVEAHGLHADVTLQMGTLGKALGAFGAYVAASRPMIDLLMNTARSFIFTTALPPPVVAAADAALSIIATDADRRRRLQCNAARLWEGLRGLGIDAGRQPGHIMPIRIGDADRTMRISERLLDEGVYVQGIRPPTVPVGTSRLRVTVMSTHTRDDLDFAVDCFRRVLAEES